MISKNALVRLVAICAIIWTAQANASEKKLLPEIEPNEEKMRWLIDEGSKISNAYLPLHDEKFKIVKIQEPADVWPAFQELFGGKLGVT